LVEIAELRDHPYMLGSQFHPEFKSRPNKPHPLFSGFVQAALRQRQQSSSPMASIQLLRNVADAAE
jgi:CTP synthase